MRQQVFFENWGAIPYQEARARQQAILDEMVALKRQNTSESIRHRIIVCSHPPVFTIGKSGSMDHLLISQEQADNEQIEVYKTNRGGDITYHGPGQLVVYPILDLDQLFTDVHRYIRSLEEVIIRLLADYGLEGNRLSAYTGVWLEPKAGDWRKICAIGVHLSRWVTMHGLAFNIATAILIRLFHVESRRKVKVLPRWSENCSIRFHGKKLSINSSNILKRYLK